MGRLRETCRLCHPLLSLTIQTEIVIVIELLILIFGNCANIMIKGNVQMSLTSQTNFLCHGEYYFFKCDIIGSHLTWMMNDQELRTFVSTNNINDAFPHDPINILIQNIEVGMIEHETNFSSYLWFNYSLLPSMPSRINLTCTSDSDSLSIVLENPGVIAKPSEVNATSYFNNSSGDVMVICNWKYTGSLSMVAFFNVEIKDGDTLIDSKRVYDEELEERFVFQYTAGSILYSAVVTTIGHCNNSLQTTKPFSHDMFITEQEKGTCYETQETESFAAGYAVITMVGVTIIIIGVIAVTFNICFWTKIKDRVRRAHV